MYGATFSRSVTVLTPSVPLAIATARVRPASVATVPVSVTTPARVVTSMSLPSRASSGTNWECTFIVTQESLMALPDSRAASLVS